MTHASNQWEQVRPQFDALPYPNVPLEQRPGNHPNYLSTHSCVIPFYLRDRRVTSSQGKRILDAGCGSGVKAMAIAMANPEAHIVGVDLSPVSIDLAKKRIAHHGIQNSTEFHCLAVEELPNLDYRFDYINCDETLYLLADPVAGLKAMKAVLKPEGIIRVNMHSALQRAGCYRVQEFFTQLGYLQGALTPEEISVARQTMQALQDWAMTKREIWQPNPELETDEEKVFANFLLRGDKGTTIRDFMAMLKQADLEFISMVDWRTWNLETLFKNIEDLPIAVALGMAEMSLEEQLHLFDLLHPVHRLLDLYCGHPSQDPGRPAIADWSREQWITARVHLHPQLRTRHFKGILEASAQKPGIIQLDKYLQTGSGAVRLNSIYTSCLHPLLSGPESFTALAERWLKVRPLHPVTLQPNDPDEAFASLRDVFLTLERAGYVMIELP